jgi:putative ABC transport system substrate-binding protein
MKRLLLGLTLLLLAVCKTGLVRSDSASGAPSAEPAYRIYMALYRGMTNADRGFMDYLRDHEIPVQFIVRDASNDPDRLVAMRDEIRALAPDLVYSFGTTVTSTLAGTLGQTDPALHITEIPILFNIVADPVGARLVADLKTSGRNLTGTTHMVPIDAQYRTLREAIHCQRLGILYNPHEPNSALSVDQLAQLAERDGLSVQRAPLAPGVSPQENRAALRGAIAGLIERGVDVIYLPSDSFVIAHAGLITRMAMAAQIPTFAATEDPVRTGGATMGLVSAYYSVGQFAGYKAVQILREHLAPADIPIESINRFSFVVNVDAARRLHRFPPISLLRVAELICYVDKSCPVAEDGETDAVATEPGPAPQSATAPEAIAQISPDQGASTESKTHCLATPASQPEPTVTVSMAPGNPEQSVAPCQGGTESGLALQRGVNDHRAPLTRQQIRLIQQCLNDRGFRAGRVDGLIGPGTRGAIRRFQAAQGMEATGVIDFALLDRLQAFKPH